MAFRSAPLVALLLVLAGCGGGGGGGTGSAPSAGTPPSSGTPPPSTPPPFSAAVGGAVQKGPFIVGSTVLVNKLDSLGQPTSSTIVTEIKDSIGSFSFTADSAGPVQIVASGYYFSELTGQISSSTLTLRGIYEVGQASTQTAYVNIMTHLVKDRVVALIGRGLTVTNALAQAEREFIEAFADALPLEDPGRFSALSVYNTGNTNDEGNAYLLALSTGFYKYATTEAQKFGTATDAELTLILNKVSDDLAADGTLELPGFMPDFIKAIRNLSPTEIAANLRSRSIVDYPAGLDVPNISRFLKLCGGVTECAWRAGAPMPLQSRGHAVAEFGGKLYVFGGVTLFDLPSTPAPFRHAWVYDPVANTWTALAPMPVGASYLRAHTVGNKIYVLAGIGASGFTTETMEYDPLANTWSLKTPSPTYRYEFATSVVKGRIYAFGGHGTIDDGPWASGKPWTYKDRVSIYDPATDTWSQGQPMPMPLASAASCAVGDKIYVFGGRNNAGMLPAALEYDVTSNSWSSKAPLSVAKEGFSCVRVNDQLYLLGGRNSTGAPLDAVDQYDPATDTWKSPTRLPTARYWLDAGTVGGEIFIVGGQVDYTELSTVVEILNPLL